MQFREDGGRLAWRRRHAFNQPEQPCGDHDRQHSLRNLSQQASPNDRQSPGSSSVDELQFDIRIPALSMLTFRSDEVSIEYDGQQDFGPVDPGAIACPLVGHFLLHDLVIRLHIFGRLVGPLGLSITAIYSPGIPGESAPANTDVIVNLRLLRSYRHKSIPISLFGPTTARLGICDRRPVVGHDS